MSATISGPGKRHWHNSKGKHTMSPPTSFGSGYPRRSWDADERAYQDHLDEHEREATIPEPMPGDSKLISDLFDVIANAEKTIDTARKLIIAHRLRDLQE
jgi:hypothetical protein